MKKKLYALLAAAGIAGTLMSCAQSDAAVQETTILVESRTEAGEADAGNRETEEVAEGENEGTAGGNAADGTLTTNGGTEISLSALPYLTDDETAPEVFYISDITPEALIQVYEALNWTPEGRVAVKLSTGEPPASNYLRPELIKDLVQMVDGTIVECNTAYGGSRASTAAHYQVAEDHGFTEIAPVQILDENGSMTLPVEGGTQLTENYVGAAFGDYDSYLVLSHFKGHAMAGFGGAIKNISIGLGSSEGKGHIHTAGRGGSIFSGDQDSFLEAMGDAGKSVSDYLGNGERIVYVNVMNRLSVDCDCDGNPAQPDMHDIGILASRDPVAVDQACIDLVYAAPDSASLVERIESRNGLHTLENAGAIGLGSRSYRLVDLSKKETGAGNAIRDTGFNLETRTVTLNNGMEMPILGIGTFSLSPEEAENSVYHALLDGYRLIDTANAYMKE